MEILTKLSPAETYLVRDHAEATFKELLKLTLADLMLKRVLVTKYNEQKNDDEEDTSTQVIVGENFRAYVPKPHETVFLNPFISNPETEILFSQLIKMAYQNGRNRKKYVFKFLLKNPDIENLFSKRLMTMWLGNVILNGQGEQVKIQVDEALLKLEKGFKGVIERDKQTALKILQNIYGNVFLIDGLESELLKEIDSQIDKQLTKYNTSGGFGCAGYFGAYGDGSDSFDVAFDSVDSSYGSEGGSGCIGASGCSSGCSGCGGCGS